MKCALTKILPFLLTLLVGLVVGNFSWRPGFLEVGAGQQKASKDTAYRRTWLVIHYQPPPSFPQPVAGTSDDACSSTSLRVRFDVNGKVSKVLPENIDEPQDCVAAAIEAARQIVFTPASENGKPLSVVATVSYGFSEMRVRVMDEKGHAPYCLTRRSPVVSPVKIVSVEGAKEAEGWRIVYE